MTDPALNLKVNVTGAQQGAAALDQVAKGTEKVTQAAGKSVGATKGAADAAKGLGASLTALGSRNNDAKDILEGVTAAAKGNEGALFGVAKAARAAFAVFASGPIGIAVAGLALVGTALLALADKFGPPKKSAEELAKEVEEAKKRVEELGKARIEQLTSDITAAKTQATEATQALDEMLAAQQRIADANKNAALAQNRNDETITEAERTRREFAINDRFAKNDDERKLNSLQEREKIAGQTLGRTVQANAQNEIETQRALAEFNDLQAKKSRLEELNKTQDTDFLNMTQSDFSARQREVKSLQDQTGPKAIEANKARVESALDATQKGRDEIFKAEKELAAATQKLKREREVQAEVTKAREAEVSSNQKKAVKEATKTDIEKAQQRKTTNEEQQKLAKEIADAQAAGDFGKQAELSAEFARRKKLADLEGPAPKATSEKTGKINTFAPDAKPGEEFIKARQLSTEPTINDQPVAPRAPATNRINIGSDFKEAADKVKAQPPADLEPVAEASRELADAVIAQTQATQESVNTTGSQLVAKAAEIPPPPSLEPILAGVTAVATTLKAGQDVLRQDVDRISQGLRILAQQIAAKRS